MNKVVVGAQWGDEGKAKITDLLAQDADLIIRYQGGCNAGHTVVAHNKTFKFHSHITIKKSKLFLSLLQNLFKFCIKLITYLHFASTMCQALF